MLCNCLYICIIKTNFFKIISFKNKPCAMKKYDARDLTLNLNPARLKPLFKMRPLIHASDIVFNWATIGIAIYFGVHYFNPLTYLFAILVIGARMHALAILMHDATHYRFLKNRNLNDLITNVVTMYPLFLTIEKYRTNHLRHHQHLNTDEDPDWVSKFGRREFQFPTTLRAFITCLLSYFLLVQGIKDALWFVQRFNIVGKKKSIEKQNPVTQLAFYGTLIITLSIFGLWKYFLLFWVVPYFSTFLMFQYIRSVAEHFGELKYESLLSSSRTVKTNIWERFFIAPHNVGYHLEHHLYPGVPYHNLPKLHQLLMESEEYKSKAHITHGYLTGLLKELT